MAIIMLAMASLPIVEVGARDLHALWEDRCGDCHTEAGDFARRHLQVVDGKLVGHHANRNLRAFLQNHYLKGNEVDAVYAMLSAQTLSGSRFSSECGSCHGNAATLVRESVVHRNEQSYGRKSGRALDDFLQGHAGLTDPDDVTFFLILLQRVAREVDTL